MTIIIAIFSLFLLLIGLVVVDVILTLRRQKSRATTQISEPIYEELSLKRINKLSFTVIVN